MKLNSLKLENFRCFKSIKIDFDEQLTVLVAENGAGKTAILDGVAVAFGVFVGSFDTGTNKSFKVQDVRLERKEILLGRPTKLTQMYMESMYPVIMIAEGIINDKPIKWNRKLTGSKSKTTVVNAKVLTHYGKNLQQKVREWSPNDITIDLPIVAYYGTGRLWRQIKVTEKSNRESNSRLFGYHDALEPASSYKEFEKWFRDSSIIEYEKIYSRISLDPNIKLSDLQTEETTPLKNVTDAVDISLKLAGWKNLHYDPTRKELVIEDNFNNIIPVNHLSDGVKSMLAMIADIAYRCTKLNPHLVSSHQETNGIILIDEIDMHLHPKWQQTVLQELQLTFPKIQFIVTTHSPQVLTTVKAKHIRILSNDSQSITTPTINTYDEESKVTLEDVLHVSSRPVFSNGKSQRLKEYLQRINHGEIDTPEIISMRKQLENDFELNYSKLKLADMVINKWKAKRVNL